MSRYDESKHPRDKDGQWRRREEIKQNAGDIADLVGTIYAGYKADQFATKAFDSALQRWGIVAGSRFARFGIPALRLVTGVVVAGAAASPVGALASTAAMFGADAYFGFRDYMRRREQRGG